MSKDGPTPTPLPEPPAQRSDRLSFGPKDELRWVTILTGVGVIAAVFLALIGGYPFDTPMPTHEFGWVEPTCGLTRGSTAIARGDFGLAWQYNPASFLVMGFAVAGLLRTVIGLTTHRWLNVSWRFNRVAWAVIAIAIAVLWIHQQQNATFIINSRV